MTCIQPFNTQWISYCGVWKVAGERVKGKSLLLHSALILSAWGYLPNCRFVYFFGKAQRIQNFSNALIWKLCASHFVGSTRVDLIKSDSKAWNEKCKRIFYIHHNIQYLWRENTSGSARACVWVRPTLLWRVTCLPGHVWHQGHVLLADMEPGDDEEHQGGQHRHHGHHSLSDTELLLLSIVTI